MLTYKKTVTEENPRLVIEVDDFADDPRNWDNLGYFITVDNRYNSPDENETLRAIVKETGEEASSQKEHVTAIKKRVKAETGEKVLYITPVYKYEHSAISYYMGTAHGFDYSNNGFYIVTDKSAAVLGTDRKDFEEVINQELTAYNQYLNGDVYHVTIFDENGEEVESCGDLFGLEAVRDGLPAEFAKEDLYQYFKK